MQGQWGNKPHVEIARNDNSGSDCRFILFDARREIKTQNHLSPISQQVVTGHSPVSSSHPEDVWERPGELGCWPHRAQVTRKALPRLVDMLSSHLHFSP